MKKYIVLFALLAVAAAGCNRQPQEDKGQAAYPGGAVTMKSPEEIRQLELLANQTPKNPEGWILLGNALMDSSRYAEAATAYQKALDVDPKNTNVRVDMGTCLRNTGNPQQAIAEYRKALKIDPNHVNAHRNMAVVLAFDLRDNKAAIPELEKYLQLAPNAPDAGEVRKVLENLKAGK
jgi:cytochrome c-type biogenesis protein CcmH/NrfG